jgi:antirestriction protein ArdC
MSDKTQELLKQLKDGVSELLDSDKWEEYLIFQSRFHQYSASNVMLILMQKPVASFVAGYKKWQEMGRFVKKGEHGISILAPMTRKQENEKGEESLKVLGFRSVNVFDVSQTDGKELPLPSRLLTGEVDEQLMSELVRAARNFDFSVEFGDAHGANGFIVGKEIVVEAQRQPTQQVKTLLHEMAHGLLHSTSEVLRDQDEVEAESVAYVVCHHLGIDSSDYSFGYVATWGRENPDAVLQSADRIAGAARKIIQALEKPAEKAA